MSVMLLLFITHHGVQQTPEGIRPTAYENKAEGDETQALDSPYPNRAVRRQKKRIGTLQPAYVPKMCRACT